jgi:ligand-binding sensor domain-containing protein
VRLQAQGLQDWKTITYLNNITDMVYSHEEIWVSSTGGVYQFNTVDSSYQTYNNLDGIGELDLTSIETDSYNSVYASSRDGQINRFDRDSGLWTIYNNLGGEVIVDLYTHGDTLWVATNSGVGVFLIFNDRLEFRDFYNNFPERVDTAYKISVFNQNIYYATEAGLYKAPSNFIKHNLKVSEAWQILTVSDGLPTNSVREVVPTQDSLLIGTTAGAASINLLDQLSVINSWTRGEVFHIRVAGPDRYFIRSGEIYKEVDGAWPFVGGATSSITSAIIDSESELWVGMDRGGIKHTGWSNPFLIDGPASNHVGPIVKDDAGSLWISSGTFKRATFYGMYYYDFANWANYHFSGNEWARKNSMVSVYKDSDGKIWAGNWGGAISVFSTDNIDFYHAWPGSGQLTVETIYGSESQAADELPADRRSCLAPVSNGPAYYTVIAYFKEDNFGNLWVANHGAEDGNYLAVLPRNENNALQTECSNWIYFGRNIGFSEDEGQVSAIEFDDFNRAWIATYETGVIVFDYNGTIDIRGDDNPIIRLNTQNANLFSNRVLSLAKDRDGIMWIGTSGGLTSFDGQNFFKHVGDTGPIENKINAIVADNFNNKWFATDGGLSILKADESPWDPEAWVHYTPENSGLPDKIVNSIFVDQEAGETYIGTESGLSIFSGSFSELKKEMNSVISGPSPFLLDDNTDFTIKNMAAGASVKILNVNGKLVRLLNREEGNIEGGRATWDGKDQSGTKVASGIYIYLIYNDEGITASGKIAVINP